MIKLQKIKSQQAKNSKKNLHPTFFNLSDFNKKKVELHFSVEQVSNDGGLLLLKEVEQQIGLIIAACIKDTCHQSYVDTI